MPTPQLFPDSINTSTEGMIAEFRKTSSVICLTVLVVASFGAQATPVRTAGRLE
jgi:hypothetical protein